MMSALHRRKKLLIALVTDISSRQGRRFESMVYFCQVLDDVQHDAPKQNT